MERGPQALGPGLATLVALAVLLRLAPAVGQPVTALGEFRHDDALFVRLAGHLVRGEGLGPYDPTTLSKRPFFPRFIAGAHRAGVPLPLAEHGLHALACLAMLVALAPLVPDRRTRVALFLLLLFDPMPWVEGRVVRHRVAAGLALATVAGLTGALARVPGGAAPLAGWSALGGLALGASWLTREEAVWILPAAAILLVAAVRRVWVEVPEGRPTRLLALALAPALALGTVHAALRSIERAYGVATLSEVSDPAFTGAVSALYRVRHPRPLRFVPAPEPVRRALYAAVPAFAELAPALEGPSGAWWARHGRPLAPEAGPRDVLGNWFTWSLRDAAAAAGHFVDAPRARAYWSRLAREVERACDEGRLDCTPPLGHPLPPWHPECEPAFVRAWLAGARAIVGFEGVHGNVGASIGTDAQLEPFRLMTGAPLAPRAGEPQAEPDLPALLRTRVVPWVGWLYGLAGPLLGLGALARLVLRRPRDPLGVLAWGTGLSVAALLTILALVDAMLFPGLGSQYLVPASPLFLAGAGAALAAGGPISPAARP